MKSTTFILLFSLLLASCAEERNDAVKSQSPDGHITLTVSAKRESAFSPWSTNLVAQGEGLKGNISFEFYAKDINDETVKFEWEGSETCTVTFMQQDDTKRVFEFTPNSSLGMWKDLTEK
ncbi:MAG: hypothetical protein IPP77_14230 [Bacteroidetes bacterium]|nr:hypothetical protein [Bacteroidota bacterium]